MLRYILMSCFIFIFGCSKSALPPKAPDRLPITEQARSVSMLPKYQAPTPGNASGLSEGDLAPFDGILLDETKATAAASLRISYDEVYWLAESNRKALLTIVTIQEQELMRADEKVKKQNETLHELRDSWWSRNKLTVGVFTGLIVGIGLTAGAGSVWAKIDEE